MKPTTHTIITAIRAGHATRAELIAHHDCHNADLTKPVSNLMQRNLIDRYMEYGGPAYRLTELGKAWQPDQRGVSLKAAMQKGKAVPHIAEAAPSIAEVTTEFANIDVVFATAPELQYLAPEDYEMPEPDAKLLALANRELSKHLDATRAELETERMRLAACDKLQRELDAKAHECCGNCEPDLETVPLASLIESVAAFLDAGQDITIHDGGLVTINAFGCTFGGGHRDANALLGATETLRRAEATA